MPTLRSSTLTIRTPPGGTSSTEATVTRRASAIRADVVDRALGRQAVELDRVGGEDALAGGGGEPAVDVGRVVVVPVRVVRREQQQVLGAHQVERHVQVAAVG